MQNGGDLTKLVFAADERRGDRGEVPAAPAVGGNRGDRRIVREDRFLEPPEIRARLEPQLVREHAPCLLERLERIRLAAAAVERQHQLPPEPLPERVVDERRAQRRCQLTVLSEPERHLELLLERVNTQRLEPACLGGEPHRLGQTLQRRSPPQCQRRRDRVLRSTDVAVPQRGARLREQFLEPERVHERVLQGVAIGEADDRLAPERRAKPCDVVMKGVPRSGRQLLPP